MRRGWFVVPVFVVAVALVGGACAAPPAPATWKIKPVSIKVNNGEDNDGGDEPYVIQVGFRSKLGVADSSQTSISSQCYRNKLPANNAAPNGTTVLVPPGSADVEFPNVLNLDIPDLAAGTTPFEVIGTLTFVMERDGIFGGCAISDALRNALLGVDQGRARPPDRQLAGAARRPRSSSTSSSPTSATSSAPPAA